MTEHWMTTLQCPNCRTIIRYEDERPPWRESVSIRKALGEARSFAEENMGAAIPGIYTGIEVPEIIQKARPHLPFLSLEFHGGFDPSVIRGVKDVDLRCVSCPACDAEVFAEHGVTPESADAPYP